MGVSDEEIHSDAEDHPLDVSIASGIAFEKQIPCYDYKSKDLLSLNDRHLSKFFKCLPELTADEGNDRQNRCFYSTNDGQEFCRHSQECHQHVLCIYCRIDGKVDDKDVEVFATTDTDRLVDHMIQTHGKRVHQCNQCLYRAISATHVQMHQISCHTQTWADHNANLTIDALDELREDICKIIVCKESDLGPDVDPIHVITNYAPKLDTDLDDDHSYCLYCGFHTAEVADVLIHCVDRHPDFAIDIYSADKENRYAVVDAVKEEPEESDEAVAEDSDSDSDSDVEKKADSQPLTSTFRTQCRVDCNADIPLISDGVLPYRPPRQQHTRPRRSLTFDAPNRAPTPPPNPIPIPSDDDDDYTAYHEPLADDYVSEFYDSVPSPSQFDVNFDNPIPSTSTGATHPPNRPFKPVFGANSKSKPKVSEKLVVEASRVGAKQGSFTDYQLHKLQRFGSLRVPKKHMSKKDQKRTSTPKGSTGDGLPPEIDLNMISNDLNMGSDEEEKTRSNAFKVIKRVGVPSAAAQIKGKTPKTPTKPQAFTYVPQTDEPNDDYVKLVNEEPIPRRGLKARFENMKHFDVFQPKRSAATNHMYKCTLCPAVEPFPSTKILFHLKDHNADHNLRCGHCDLIGGKLMITEHSKECHPSLPLKILKFIIDVNQSESVGMTSGASFVRNKVTARKSTATASTSGSVVKGGKGALTQKILNTLYVDLGPTGTDRKRSIDDTADDNPFKRVHSRTKVSSNLKRQKRDIDYDLSLDSDDGGDSGGPPSGDDYDDMPSDAESAANEVVMDENNDNNDVEVVMSPHKQSVARKSTAKPSSQSQSQPTTFLLTDDQIPSKYFCVFCREGFTINNKTEAIEHYKSHLKLGYQCCQCRFSCVAYSSMADHWKAVHKSDDMDFEENMPEEIRQWILDFLDNQLKYAVFSNQSVASSATDSGLNIVCPICVKAAHVCGLTPAPIDALWRAKLHICKHLHWLPMRCDLCTDMNTENNAFPNNPYILMKHLITVHFTDCENFYNISFRGQKAYNDMKREQLRLIERHYTEIRVTASDMIDSFFTQLLTEMDILYEDQLRDKFDIRKEIRINLSRCVHVKREPVDECDGDGEVEARDEVKDEVKREDKKDIKTEVKTEVKAEIKSEVKNEAKNEVKDETSGQPSQQYVSGGQSVWDQLYGTEDVILVSDSDDEN
ncbi:unnamed protein product [Oppiella nova]|uniref:C2H2-type domain-containing protein n=1 Tax=Oppiella nova TaxID=334625 RepID=A0A7R9LWQ5_9ACAR|nr:unnamed protein product [Oppiella nova]CAG2167746.1 unnamed protein product [Oppiella nova]